MRVAISLDALFNIELFYKSFANKHRYYYSIQMMVIHQPSY